MGRRCGGTGSIKRVIVGRGARLIWHVATSMLVVAIAFPAAGAQDHVPARYTLHGVVRDSADAPIPSATVSVYGFAGSATTNERGEFSLGGLLRGTRVVEVIAMGFKPRLVALAISERMPDAEIVMARAKMVVLDSVQITENRPIDMPITSRQTDRITETELSRRDIIGGTALDAFALLRPRLFHGRPPPGSSASNAASQRAQVFPRDTVGQGATFRTLCVGNPACNIDGQLSVSINEARPGSPDILTTLPVRIVKEMRYLLAVDAAARFGILAGGGPVLVVYTK